MDVDQALADLREISSQIEAAVLLDQEGRPLASTLADDAGGERLARAAWELLAAAGETRGPGGEALTQLEAATHGGSVFVVRDEERAIAATTGPEPTVGLVFYDLKSALRTVAASTAGNGARPRRRRGKKAEDAAS